MNNIIRKPEHEEQCCKSFDIPGTSLSILIILSSTKLFLDLYLAKFLDISAKPFFSCDIGIDKIHNYTMNNIMPRRLTRTLDK